MSEPSPDVMRNAALRAALRARWPEVTFGVRRGKCQRVNVTWTDGPAEVAVWGVVNEERGRDRSTWWDASLERHVSCELVAVAFLRRHDSSTPFYSERDPKTGLMQPPDAPPLTASTLASWSCCWVQLDAADLTARDRLRARLVIALAGDTLSIDGEKSARLLGRTVMLHGPILEAVLA